MKSQIYNLLLEQAYNDAEEIEESAGIKIADVLITGTNKVDDSKVKVDFDLVKF